MPVVLTEEQLAQMKEYNLDDVRDIDTHELYGDSSRLTRA